MTTPYLLLAILAVNALLILVQWLDDGMPTKRADLSPGFWWASSAVTLLTWSVLLTVAFDSITARAVLAWVAVVSAAALFRPWARAREVHPISSGVTITERGRTLTMADSPPNLFGHDDAPGYAPPFEVHSSTPSWVPGVTKQEGVWLDSGCAGSRFVDPDGNRVVLMDYAPNGIMEQFIKAHPDVTISNAGELIRGRFDADGELIGLDTLVLEDEPWSCPSTEMSPEEYQRFVSRLRFPHD